MSLQKICVKITKVHNIFTVFLFAIIHYNSYAQQPNKTILTPELREYHIQKALKFREQQNLNAATNHLDSILNLNSNDAGALLFKGDLLMQQKKFKEAAQQLKILLPLKYETTITKINLSYALFMSHQPKNALFFAKDAWLNDPKNNNAVVNYFNALLWNSKTNTAEEFLKTQNHLLSTEQILVLKARLYTTKGDFKSGLSLYDSLAKQTSNKYYKQEYAEVLLGKKELEKSNAVMSAAKAQFSETDYQNYLDKVKQQNLNTLSTSFVYFKDVASNTRLEQHIWWQQSPGKKFQFKVGIGNGSIKSAVGERTNTQFAHLGLTERWSLSLRGETDLHFQLITPVGKSNFNGFTGKQSIIYQPNDRRMMGLQISSDILNFTAELYGKNIRNNSLGYVTHLMFSGKTGFYSQGSAGYLTDGNKSLQVFGSVYHLLRTEPTLKGGINFSALHFQNNLITAYFSPNKYLSSEVFIDYGTALPMFSKYFLQLQAAAGTQRIENNKWESAMRLQAELGYRLKHFDTSIKYQTSNVAAATGTGYSFNWFTLNLIYKW